MKTNQKFEAANFVFNGLAKWNTWVRKAILPFMLLAILSSQALAQPSILSISETAGGVEITINDPDGFRVGALPYALMVGDKAFWRSYHPGNGDTRTLAFLLTIQEFNQLQLNDSIVLDYGGIDGDASMRWELGNLDENN